MTPEDLYILLTQIATSVSAALFVILLFLQIPGAKALKSFGKTRYLLLAAFFIVTVLNVAELTFGGLDYRYELMAISTLTIASIQVFLFSATLIILLNEERFSRAELLWELTPSLQLAFVGFFLFYLDAFVTLNYFFWFFGAYLVFQIIRYTFIYIRQYKAAVQKMDNYYSEQNSHQLRWSRLAFFTMIGGTILSALSIFGSMTGLLIFTCVYIIFYLFFGIHYLNFSYFLLEYGGVINATDETALPKERSVTGTYEYLEEAIIKWEKQKMYLEPHITIDQVASQLSTNRTYLSNYMNTYRNMSFKDWINQLRIDESTRLMTEHPELPVSQIGVMVGLQDKSNFGRQFSKEKGISPQAWKKAHCL